MLIFVFGIFSARYNYKNPEWTQLDIMCLGTLIQVLETMQSSSVLKREVVDSSKLGDFS